ncbi:O-antigen ligase family protein [Flavobacterium cerinum]|uniref:Tetratricopeptide repeat protein n=1 Tax=Flavobacterium cerinum TaxID=2502784 RepID=A0A3S3Q2P8_9FLAO|nr:O-antigen ligase family protein [Flavobacterium cerinum]RWW91668.1 tetratricopeptide repeat protein [Flavobacterium cerinum]
MSVKAVVKNNKNSIKPQDKERISNSDFVLLFYIVALLIIDFFPYFNAMEIIHPQFLYLSLLNVAVGGFLYLNGNISFINILPILKKNYIPIAYFVFLLFCTVSIFNAKNIGVGIVDLIQLIIVFCLLINLVILLQNRLHLFYKIIFFVGISAFLQASQELYNLIKTSNLSSVVSALNNLKGNTGNINILAASLTIKIPFVLIGITYFKSKKKWFLYTTLFLALTTVFLTAARTPLISLSLIFCIYIFYSLKINSFKKSSILSSGALLLVVVLSTVTTNLIFEKTKDTSRFNSVEDRIKQISSTEGSANARLAYWSNSIKLAKTSPIIGIGLGNYAIESIPYEKEFSNDNVVSLKSHNDFLEILAETGLLNFLIYLSIFVYIFFINLKRIIKYKDGTTRTIAVGALMLVIVYGIDALFNFPMYRPTMQIFFGLCLALTIMNSSFIVEQDVKVNTRKKIVLVLIAISLVTSYFAYENYKASTLEYLIKTDNIDANAKGVLTGDEVIKRMPKYKNIFGTSESFYEYAAIYYLRENKYEKAMKYFSEASKINPYSGRINFYKHIMARNKGDIDSSYTYSKESFYLRPRNYFFYQNLINLAANKQDTTEIIKAHNLFSKYIKKPEEWQSTALELQRAGYPRPKLLEFIDEGLKVLPNDSLLIKQKNDFLITDYIIDGQNYSAKFQMDKALNSYLKALELEPENIYIMQNLGFYYYNLNKHKEAIPYFLNALKYPGLNDGKTEYYTGISYLKNNDLENACKYFNLSKTKNFPEAQQQIELNCK